MPANNCFRSQSYEPVKPTAVYEFLTPELPPIAGSADYQRRAQVVGRAFEILQRSVQVVRRAQRDGHPCQRLAFRALHSPGDPARRRQLEIPQVQHLRSVRHDLADEPAVPRGVDDQRVRPGLQTGEEERPILARRPTFEGERDGPVPVRLPRAHAGTLDRSSMRVQGTPADAQPG